MGEMLGEGSRDKVGPVHRVLIGRARVVGGAGRPLRNRKHRQQHTCLTIADRLRLRQLPAGTDVQYPCSCRVRFLSIVTVGGTVLAYSPCRKAVRIFTCPAGR